MRPPIRSISIVTPRLLNCHDGVATASLAVEAADARITAQFDNLSAVALEYLGQSNEAWRLPLRPCHQPSSSPVMMARIHSFLAQGLDAAGAVRLAALAERKLAGGDPPSVRLMVIGGSPNLVAGR